MECGADELPAAERCEVVSGCSCGRMVACVSGLDRMLMRGLVDVLLPRDVDCEDITGESGASE